MNKMVQNEFKKSFHSSVLQDWYVPAEYRWKLEKYYLLYWQREYFERMYFDGYGSLKHQGDEYLVVYHNTTPRALSKYSEVKLSFRRFDSNEFHYGYVLVTPLIDMEIT